jgi:flagellin-like hook-associated protein FlgL
MSATNVPVPISSISASTDADDTKDHLDSLRDDVQRLSNGTQVNKQIIFGGYQRVCAPYTGQLRLVAYSDAASIGSSGVNFMKIYGVKNGVGTSTTGMGGNGIIYDTSKKEVPLFQGGIYLGEIGVAQGDVIQVGVATTGAPTVPLAASNFTLLCTLKTK